MPALKMAKREVSASGYNVTASVDHETYHVEVSQHTRKEASAPWRKPQRWTSARVCTPDGTVKWSGRVYASTKPADILLVSKLVFRCSVCGEVRSATGRDETLGACRECSDSIVFAERKPLPDEKPAEHLRNALVLLAARTPDVLEAVEWRIRAALAALEVTANG